MSAFPVWMKEEDKIILDLYCSRNKQMLLTALPGRSWVAIRGRAQKIGAAGVCRIGKNRHELRDGYAVVFLEKRDGSLVPTTIDIDDLYLVLSAGKWRAHWNGIAFYARNNKHGFLQRFLLKCPRDKEADHEDRDTLNNRRSNLRVLTKAENAQNKAVLNPYNKSSGIRGLIWNKSLKLWVATVTLDRKRFCKYAKTVEDAQLKLDALRRELHPASVG